MWRGRVFEPRASAHRFGVPRLHLWVRGRVCAARGVPRSSDSLSRKLENSHAQPYSHGRRLFMPCGRARASAAVRLGQAMPGAPLDTAAPSRAPRVAPFRKLRVADAWFTRSAKACATRSFRFAAAPSVVRSSSDGTQDASKTLEVRKPGRSVRVAQLHEFGEGRRELRRGSPCEISACLCDRSGSPSPSRCSSRPNSWPWRAGSRPRGRRNCRGGAEHGSSRSRRRPGSSCVAARRG